MNKASFVQRLVAWLADQAILLIIHLLVVFVFGLLSGVYNARDIQAPIPILSLGVTVFALVLSLEHFLYFGYLWSRRERSIGMGLMNIRVIVKADQHSLSFLMAGLRGSVGYYLSGLVFGLGYLWFFFDKRRETWHDKVFNTAVLKG